MKEGEKEFSPFFISIKDLYEKNSFTGNCSRFFSDRLAVPMSGRMAESSGQCVTTIR